MKFTILLLLCALSGCCRCASISDAMAVEAIEGMENPTRSEVLLEEPIIETRTILEEVPVPEKVDEQKVIEEHVDAVPFDVNNVQDAQFPAGISPIAAEEVNAQQGQASLIDEVAAERAEREADIDLLKALDSVLTKKETLEDVIKTEDVSLE